jgi:hypothetical protein
MAFLWTSLAPLQEFSPVVLVVSVERVSAIALPDELVGMKLFWYRFRTEGIYNCSSWLSTVVYPRLQSKNDRICVNKYEPEYFLAIHKCYADEKISQRELCSLLDLCWFGFVLGLTQ